LVKTIEHEGCIFYIELVLFYMFWPIKFLFWIRHYLWNTLSIYWS
jgi:hypothetical protein